jgi:hypothetical protein
MNPALLTLLAGLATYRLTRLVTADRIFQAPRAWVVQRYRRLGYLVTCDWCLSIWVAPAPAVAVILWPDNRAVLVGLVALSASAFTGLASLGEARLDQE